MKEATNVQEAITSILDVVEDKLPKTSIDEELL